MLDPGEVAQLIMGVLLGVLGYISSKALSRLDQIEKTVADIDRALIRLDTKFGEHLEHDGRKKI